MKHLLTFACLISLNVFSQSPFNSESTAVTRADLTTNVFEKDSTANAVVLYESGNSYFDKKNTFLITEVKKKIKIFNKNNLDKSTVTIYLYNNDKLKENINAIEATTYNLENDNIIDSSLNKDQIFIENFNENYTLIKFTLPNVKEGSVITYSYVLESPFIFKFKGWHFQDNIPKLFSIYNTSIPVNINYNIKLIGYLKLSLEDYQIEKKCRKKNIEVNDYQLTSHIDCKLSTYTMKDIPAFVEEDFMTTKNNYLSRLDFEIKSFGSTDYTKKWEDIDFDLYKDIYVGEQLKKTLELRSFLNKEIINEKNATKKASAIYRYVQSNYTWDGEYDIFKKGLIKDLIQNKSGNVSSINMFLHNLLSKANLEVKPVLLSTRENGFATKIHPTISDFNYLIVQLKINDNTYLLDATDKYVSFGELPFRCLNQYGRLLDFDKGSSWIDISPGRMSFIRHEAKLNLDNNLILSGTIDSKSTGYHAMPLKESFFGNPKAHLDHYENKFTNINFLDYSVSTTDHSSFDFDESFKIEYQTEQVSDNLYINPFIFKFFTENPFKLQERSYPIDFGFKDTFVYNTKILLSDNFEVIEIPKEEMFSLPNNKGTVILSSKIENNQIMIYFKVSFNDALFDPSYYNALKIYLGKIVDIQKNALIVLKKK